MAVRLTDVVKNYENEGSGDISEWLEKVELVASLQKIEKLENFVPLFLSGSAFAVYKQLPESDRREYKKLKGRLIQAFGSNEFEAYGSLQRRVLESGETVDVFIADLKRLVSLMGQSEPEPLLRCAFVAGLPSDVAVQMKSISAVENLSLTDLVDRARMILSARTAPAGPCAAGRPVPGQAKLTCFLCGGQGHMMRQCPNKKGGGQREITCFGCGEVGHIKRYCKKDVAVKQQGNE